MLRQCVTQLPLGIGSEADGQQWSQFVFGADPGHGHHGQGADWFEANPEKSRGTNHCHLWDTGNTERTHLDVQVNKIYNIGVVVF